MEVEPEKASRSVEEFEIPLRTEAEAETAPESLIPGILSPSSSTASDSENEAGAPMPQPAATSLPPDLSPENSGRQPDSAPVFNATGGISPGPGSSPETEISSKAQSGPQPAVTSNSLTPAPASSQTDHSSVLPTFPHLNPLPAFPPLQAIPAPEPDKIPHSTPLPAEAVLSPPPMPGSTPEPELKVNPETDPKPEPGLPHPDRKPEVISAKTPAPAPAASRSREPISSGSSAESDLTDPLLVFADDFSVPASPPETRVSPAIIPPMPEAAPAAPVLPSWPEKRDARSAASQQNEEPELSQAPVRTMAPPVSSAPLRPLPLPARQAAPAAISPALPEFPKLTEKKALIPAPVPAAEPDEDFRSESRFFPAAVLITVVLLALIITAVWFAL